MGLISSFLNRIKKGIPEGTRTLFSNSGGSVVSPDTAMKVAAYYRGVIFISTQIAKLPVRITDSANKAVKHKADVLFNLMPNEEMDAQTFKLLAIQTAINYGNFFAEIERNRLGEAVALHPIPTSSVQLYRTQSGELVYGIAEGSGTVYLKWRDVFHLKNFHLTSDGLLGQGLVAYASEVLGIQMGADKFANSLFANGGLPSGVLMVEGELSDESFERIKTDWKTQTGGRKTGGVVVLEQGAKYTPITFPPEVLQFLDSRKFGISEIAKFLGVPPQKLFDSTAAKYNSNEQASLEVTTDTLDPWARSFEMEVNNKILDTRKTGTYSDVVLFEVSRGDSAARVNYYSKMMQNAAITPNQIRNQEGLEPYEGGDEYFLAVNNLSPIRRINEIIDAQIKSKEPKESTKEEEKESESEDEGEEEDSEMKEIDKETKKAILKFLKNRS